MNVVMKTLERFLVSESSRDKCSRGFFANLIGISHRVSNKPQQIKKTGNYDGNRQFLLTVGREMIRDALKIFFGASQ